MDHQVTTPEKKLLDENVKHHEPLVKHHETLIKHQETLEHLPLNVKISALDASIPVPGMEFPAKLAIAVLD